MNVPEKNYTTKGGIAVTALLTVLVAASFIPPQTIGGVKLRRTNIFADLFAFDDLSGKTPETVLFDEAEFQIDMSEVAERIEADTTAPKVQVSFEWALPGVRKAHNESTPPTMLSSPVLCAIEDFDSTSLHTGMQGFYDKLLYSDRPVRIAFLGDSFVEGDIFTADLRESLQITYGGMSGGAGFAPMASPLTAFRRTIKTQSKGWTSYNIMQRKAAPAALRDNFFVSGWVCQPSAEASTRWESTTFRQRLDSCTQARVLFISPRDSRVELTLNDTLQRQFTVPGDNAVRQIAVEAPHIRSLSFRILSGHEGFIGYGAVFESQGVSVDNYSVRSNNGQAMFWTNPSVNAQINALAGYDLVILQYGLNIMQPGVYGYTHYGQQIEKMVAYVRQCFPGAAVLILGVSDRSMKTDAGFVPMDALPSMLACQRQAARNTSAAFWNTCDAMRSHGGMSRFVQNGWAGKDFTHINYAGGRRVASSLVDALNAGAGAHHKLHQQINETRRINSQSILDTARRHRIEQWSRTVIAPDSMTLLRK